MKVLITLLFLISSLFGWVAQITALKGEAFIIRDNNTIPAVLNMKLEKEDSIETKNNTKMQIIFKDDTVITIGKNSVVKIVDYLFDNENSKAKFRLKHGIMKTLTGKIAKFAPKRFKVLTKNASIGIRGTYFVVESYEDTIKVGMLMGEVEFTNLINMKTYIIKKGEQLVFYIKQPNNIKIQKGFIEPKSIKLNTTKVIKTISNNILKNTSSIQADAIKNQKDITIDQPSTSSKFYNEFIRSLFK